MTKTAVSGDGFAGGCLIDEFDALSLERILRVRYCELNACLYTQQRSEQSSTMNDDKRRLTRLLLVLCLGLVTLVFIAWAIYAINPVIQSPAMQKPAKQWISDLILRSNEIPQGWRAGGTEIHNIPKAEGRFAWFYNVSAKDLHWVNFSEAPRIYTSSNEAAQAYNEQVQIAFPAKYSDDLKPVPEFEPPLHAETIKSACLPMSVNDLPVLSCTVVARYQNVVVEVYGNIVEGHWLTMSDFQDVVAAVDQRIIKTLSR